MKLHLYLLPVVLTLSCTEGNKFKGAAASATVEKPYEEPSNDAVPEEVVEEAKPAPEPIVAITSLGVNFEDLLKPTSANNAIEFKPDFNDAVLCFEGGFDYAAATSTITSSKDQKVQVKTFSASGCTHDITAEVVKSDGSIRSTQSFSSKAKAVLSLEFKKGDRLEVYMQPIAKDTQCSPSVKRDMHNHEYAQTVPDVCNTTGD
jgi:hypothetical protein